MFTKLCIQVSTVLILLTTSITGFAQNKVVVIPLAGDTAYQVKSGQVLTGSISAYDSGGESQVIAVSFASPLPEGTPVPQIVYADPVSLFCPGVGEAATGYFCLYPPFSIGVVYPISSFSNYVPVNRYGIWFKVDPDTTNGDMELVASWAYKVQ